jgi:hypothetical protein
MFHVFRNGHRSGTVKTAAAIVVTTFIGVATVHADDKKIDVTIKSKTPVTVKFKDAANKPFNPEVKANVPQHVFIDPKTKSIQWQALANDKSCDGNTLSISGSTATIEVTKCVDNAAEGMKAEEAKRAEQAKKAEEEKKKKAEEAKKAEEKKTVQQGLPRLPSPTDLEKEIDNVKSDLGKIDEQLSKVASKEELEELKKRGSKDGETIARVKIILEGPQRSVIETNPSDWTLVKQKTTDAGAKLEAVQKKILHCVLAGDVSGGDAPNGKVPPPTNIDPTVQGKHVVGCKFK